MDFHKESDRHAEFTVLYCYDTVVIHSKYFTFSFYRPRTLNRFRVQGAPIGRLIIIGRLIDFEPKMVIFHGFPLIFQGI